MAFRGMLMIRSIYDLNSELAFYIVEVQKYILQMNSKSYSGHNFFKNLSNCIKFEYLTMLSCTENEESAVDLLLSTEQQKYTHAYALYGEYFIEIPLQEGLAQVEKNEKLTNLESQAAFSLAGICNLSEIYSQPVFSEKTLQEIRLLKEYVQKQCSLGIMYSYYEYCEVFLLARKRRIQAMIQYAGFDRQYIR